MEKKKRTQHSRSTHESQMRTRIQNAAFKLMAEKGIEQVSMREIAEKVKVTKPVLYYYFKNKEDLCSSIIAEHTQQFTRFLQEVLSVEKKPEVLLRQIFERHLAFFEKDPRNSNFVAHTITYALHTKLQKFKNPSQDNYLIKTLEQLAAQKQLPREGLAELECLIRAVLLQIMLSSFVRLHAQADFSPYKYDQQSVKRLAEILVLGIKQYYQKK